MAILWHAPEAKVVIAAGAISLGASESIETAMAAETTEIVMSNIVKDLTIRGGERDVEALKLLGYNELIDLKRATVMEISFTTAFQGSVLLLLDSEGAAGTRGTEFDFAEFFMGEKQTVTSTSFYRTQGGEKATNDRAACAIQVALTDGSNYINILLNSAYATSRELSLAADGHMEQTITFKCLASTYYEEDDFA